MGGGPPRTAGLWTTNLGLVAYSSQAGCATLSQEQMQSKIRVKYR